MDVSAILGSNTGVMTGWRWDMMCQI
jgi:hypothetical protein